jgi:hypothetical protein
MMWLALGGAALLQLLAGALRVRAWFHVIRHTCPDASDLRYRDVVLAHLGGAGWNSVLPARSGDAVKVVLVGRRMPERRLTTLASTLVPAALVETAFTLLLLVGLVAAGLVSLDALTRVVPDADTAVLAATVVGVGIVAALVFRRRLRQLARDLRAGLGVLRKPRIIGSRILPWLAAARGVQLVGYALILTAAGVPFGLAPALAFMALQGATPSGGAAVTAARISLLAALLAGTGGADVSAARLAEALTASYGVTSAVNLAASAGVIAWLLRTISPRRIIAYARSAMRVRSERTAPWPTPLPADGATPSALASGQVPAPGAQSLPPGPGRPTG